MIAGPHCYSFFEGNDFFAETAEDNITTFYLTDFLVRHFDRLVIQGLGIDAHPELLPEYFKNYRRVVYLAQERSSEFEAQARRCADKLGLEYRYEYTGMEHLQRQLEQVVTCQN